MNAYLQPTRFLDYEHPTVQEFSDAALSTIRTAADSTGREVNIARSLFEAVRDGIWYDPFQLSTDPVDYQASAIAQAPSGWCVPKAVLLTALARLNGIPARLGFADVRNHLSTPKLLERLRTDLFAWHGYSELWLDGRWIKLSTAFNRELCERFGVKVLEFDAERGALMHPFDTAGRKHMEYVNDHGHFEDLPLTQIFDAFVELYPAITKDEMGRYHSAMGDATDNFAR